MTFPVVLLLTALEAAPQPSSASFTPEQLAGGAVREIMSAQAYHKKTFPQQGHACSIERLVEVQALGEAWASNRRVDGYSFKLWCDPVNTPQTTYRTAAVPVKKTRGSTLTVCADETNVLRTIDGDPEACLARGATPHD